VIAASRFEGGPLVHLGFGLVFVAFGAAIAVVLLAVQFDRVPAPRRWPLVAAVPAWAAVVALWLPAYEGVLRQSGRMRVESGWSGIDPVSTTAIVAMALIVLVPRLSSSLVIGALASQAGLFAGNWLIQSFTDRPTNIRYGLSVATVLSLGALGAALVGAKREAGVRGRRVPGR